MEVVLVEQKDVSVLANGFGTRRNGQRRNQSASYGLFTETELDLTPTKRDELISLVQLYKALGGGWQQYVRLEEARSWLLCGFGLLLHGLRCQR